MTAPIAAALQIAEDAVLAALAALDPAGSAAWGVAPIGTVGDLIAGSRARYYVAQHQDDGGALVSHVNAYGWAGEVAVKVLARSDVAARAGYALAVAAMAALPSPAGYTLRASFLGEAPIPVDPDGIYQRIARYQIELEVA